MNKCPLASKDLSCERRSNMSSLLAYLTKLLSGVVKFRMLNRVQWEITQYHYSKNIEGNCIEKFRMYCSRIYQE